MRHRGPDDSGAQSQGPATLGMRRLAIYDPAHGHQPIQTPDGRFTLVFNGSIVNHADLRKELAGRWDFRTHCDTEVLLASFVQWGIACVGRLRGMFSFAVWDSREQTLHLARDPFGIKPLYYRHDHSRLVFASELNALLAGGIRPEIDPVSVGDFLAWFCVPAPKTIYRGIYSLRPGEAATYRDGRLDIQRRWSFAGIEPEPNVCSSQEEFQWELRRRLEDVIGAYAVADVPVGAFLSGGLDSSAIVGLMARTAGASLKTFAIGFDEPGYSEADEAAAVARYYGIEHHTTILTGAEVARSLEDFIAACDHPTGDGLNTYHVSRAARLGGLTVALSGLGGDEIFGGYPSFKNVPRLAALLPWWRLIPQGVRNPIIRRLEHGSTRERKLADSLNYAHDPHELAALDRRVFSEISRRGLLAQGTLEALGNTSPFHPELDELRKELSHARLPEISSAWELRTYMADLLLRDSDVMSMRHSLELRVPFVDRPLIEWLWRQPLAYRFTPRRPKKALADALRDILPPALQNRRKQGFTLPIALWMRRELRPFLDETFSEASIGRSSFFRPEAVQATWQGFLRSQDTREWSRVWSLAMLIAFINRRTPASPPHKTNEKPLELLSQHVASGGRSHTLLMVPEIFSNTGGIQRILRLYLKALTEIGARNGQGVSLLALLDPELDSTAVRHYTGAPLHSWCVCNRRKLRFVLAALRMGHNADRIICGHVAQSPVAWLARLQNPGLRYYVVAHGIEVWRPLGLLERVALRGASRIFCVSEYTRRELLRRCPLPPGRAIVLPNAIDTSFSISAGVPPAECPPVILTAARLMRSERYKGISDLIAAMPAIREKVPGAQLRVVGRGDDLPRLEALARKAGLLGGGVVFLGYVSDTQLAKEIASCRLFALPSSKEGFGIVFLEAMARGRPCLGARAGGIPEVITPETGMLVEFGDIASISAGCVEALQRDWQQGPILARPQAFSYGPFRDRLAAQLEAPPAAD